ncbi:hypothetical protein AGMMS49579_02730 [Spirochaetia bacterium]|nr:hypothetical protein AGMMS49579_02730 [Spirochaetia bacterium]
MKTAKNGDKLLFVGMTAMLLAFGSILSGCASLANLTNPAYAVDSNGEKTKASYTASEQTVKIAKIEYQYLSRPQVPAGPNRPAAPTKPSAPTKPREPTKPSPVVEKPAGSAPVRPSEPRSPTEPSFDAWFNRNYPNAQQAGAGAAAVVKMSKQQEFYNTSEYRNYLAAKNKYEADYRQYQSDLSKYNSDNSAYQNKLNAYNSYQQSVQRYNSDLQNYQNSLASYQQAQIKYEQALVQYDRELNVEYPKKVLEYETKLADYQVILPEYTAKVEAEIKSIQDSINSDAPTNWDRYVVGKYLLYRGKIK